MLTSVPSRRRRGRNRAGSSRSDAPRTRPRSSAAKPAVGRRKSAASRPIEPLRERILAAARRLCFEEGVDATSARRIAGEVGVSATAIYLHFQSIEHVLHEIRMEGHALLVEYLRRPQAEMNAVERLCAMGYEYYRFGLEHPNYFRLMFLSRIDKGQLGRLVTAEGSSLDVVREAARLGIERGEIRSDLDPAVIANVAWMSIHGLTSMVVSGHAAVTAPGLEAQLLEGIMQAMTAWLRSQ